MAKTGVKGLTIAPITAYADGAVPTYGTKTSVPYTVSINISNEYADAEMYGDNILRESDKGMTGYSIAASLTDLSPEMGAVMLGWIKDASGDSYRITDANAPYVGCGFVTCGMVNGVRYYEGNWYYRAQFTKDANSANTKERNVTFTPDDVSGTGFGVQLDNTGVVSFADIERFDNEAAAMAFVEGHIK